MLQGRLKIAGLLTTLLVVSGCWKKTEEVTKSVDTTQSGIKLINVLDAVYFDDAHIPGSLNISLDALENASKDWNKDELIVAYCANYQCSASGAAARKLMALGFTNVKAYEAGTAGWLQAGLPVDGSAQETYLTQPNEKIEHDDSSEEDDSDVEKNKVVEITTDELADVLGIHKTNS